MGEIDEKNQAQENEESGANHGHVISPEHEERVRYEEGDGHQDQPEENLGAPPSILNCSAFITSVPDTNERKTEDCMDESKSKADSVHRKNTIAFVACAVHLNVVVAPFLYLLYSDVCLHYPGKY